jgi:hypothetical protein
MRTIMILVLAIGLTSPAYASHKKHHPNPMVAGLGIGLIYMLRASRAHEEQQCGQGKSFLSAPCSEQGCR